MQHCSVKVLVSEIACDTREVRGQSDRLRVAVVGCGAMARDFHLPVLAGHEGFRLVALVDRDRARAAELATVYQARHVFGDISGLTPDLIDAVVLATPPFHHAPGTIELVGRGLHVLVEKPMALSSADAEAMVRAADKAGVVLAVGHHRRLWASSRLLRALLAEGLLGRPLRFDIEEGGPYGWPLATLSNLRKDQGGGGVLTDIGCHLLDQLLFCLPGPAEVLDYRDNALGGIETDCSTRVRLSFQGEPVEGRVELSRTRELRNTIRIECERGTLELANGERHHVSVMPHNMELVDRIGDAARDYRLTASWEADREAPGRAAYRLEMNDWLAAIRTGQPPVLDGRTAVPVVRLIEDCYRQVRTEAEPWVCETLPTTTPTTKASRRVLVTGATGFIGCRVAEILELREGCQVRALVHNPGSAARLARLPVEMVLGDLTSPADMARAVEGCDAVVHCAVPPSWWPWRQAKAVTVGGTRNLAKAAHAAGVARFVHVSTIAVYGSNVAGAVNEATPVRPDRGSVYGHSKLRAEHAVQRVTQDGLPTVILRPAHVYGPFGKTFTTRPLQSLARGELVLVGGDEIAANMIYVDNVAGAIARALGAPAGDVCGQTFTLGGEEDLTWADFYRYFADALGVRLQVISIEDFNRRQPRKRNWFPPAALAASWFRGFKEVLTSAEFRALGRKYLATDPVGRLPRWLLDCLPGLRRRLVASGPLVYQEAQPEVGREPLILNPFPARIGLDKARRLLGYQPLVAEPRAMELTLQWLRHSRLV
jgi:predicted dehydrogenase/nucleoside-diphosphate-sugar epimerase